MIWVCVFRETMTLLWQLKLACQKWMCRKWRLFYALQLLTLRETTICMPSLNPRKWPTTQMLAREFKTSRIIRKSKNRKNKYHTKISEFTVYESRCMCPYFALMHITMFCDILTSYKKRCTLCWCTHILTHNYKILLPILTWHFLIFNIIGPRS